jgi:hypothetical protein
MNRNIISQKDVDNIQLGRVPPALRRSPPAWTDAVQPADDAHLAGSGVAARLAVAAGAPTGPGGVPIPTSDDYLTKLLKYVPVEVVGAYLAINGTIISNVTNKHDLAQWLGYTLIAFAPLVALYTWRVLNVVRLTQIVMSVIGLGVYVFALGGWFATTTWYHAWYATVVLPIFALVVAIIPVSALPPDKG